MRAKRENHAGTARTGARGYFDRLGQLLDGIQVSDGDGTSVSLEEGTERVVERILRTIETSRKVVLVGNGGSAATAGHMEMDLCNRARVRAHVFNDPPVLTALANDHGYSTAFQRLVSLWVEPGDLLFAISSSGQSENILRAANAAQERDCDVVTFSGFREDNPLRSLGGFNFYVAAECYGEVEVVHLALGHYLTDRAAESAG